MTHHPLCTLRVAPAEAKYISYPDGRKLLRAIAGSVAFMLVLLLTGGCSDGDSASDGPTGTTVGTPQPQPQPSLPPQQLLATNLVLGKTGSEPGSFDEPAGLTLDAAGNLYVTDLSNHRIQKFDPEGRFLSELGGNGSGEGQFQEPWGVAVDAQGNVWVADTFNHRIQKFDPNLQFLLAVGKAASNLQDPEPDALWGPRDVATDADGNVWVADTGTGRVVKYSATGSLLQEFGDMGDGPGRFSEPTAIEVAANGEIFVADSGNRRVQRFNANFDFVAEYDIPGWLYVYSVAKPYIALLPSGGLVASDPTQNKLFRLDANGTPVATLDTEAPLVVPRGVAFDGRGYLYVAENDPDQVRRLLLSEPAVFRQPLPTDWEAQ